MHPELEKLKELHRFYKTGSYSKLGIAKALGVNRKAIQRWFKGEFEPTKRHLAKIKSLVRELELKKGSQEGFKKGSLELNKGPREPKKGS